MRKQIIDELIKLKKLTPKRYRKVLQRYPKDGNKLFSKSDILTDYNELVSNGKLEENKLLRDFLRKKPTRTLSGVAPVTLLTKPYPCPSACIFCPTRNDQPKSYMSSEPGAMRAKMLQFDPYKQTLLRVKALENIGHSVEKVEIIILGGTWSFYKKDYQTWFVLRIFQALNDLESVSSLDKLDDLERYINKKNKANQFDNLEQGKLEELLLKEQKKNESAKHKNVGLVIETRPDFINSQELKWLRFLGVTKIQIGVQSMDDEILKKNRRGHTVKQIKDAINMIRLAGFKIHAHWMLNLYGSTPEIDIAGFKKMFSDEGIHPDELKVYPCLVIEETPLHALTREGKHNPYTRQELLDTLVESKKHIQKYCRISRLFRDIPSFEITDGVKETNFREVVGREMEKRGLKCNCIRCREIKSSEFKIQNVKYEDLVYDTTIGKEHFLSYVTEDDKILGFLRFFLPRKSLSNKHFIEELKDSAIIREVHVYGVSKEITENREQKTVQHLGLGKKLLKKAEKIASDNSFKKISVISAIGTRNYYKKQGYKLGKLYMYKLS